MESSFDPIASIAYVLLSLGKGGIQTPLGMQPYTFLIEMVTMAI